MLTKPSQKIEEMVDGRVLTEEEARKMREDLAQTNFGMTVEEFTKAWSARDFDDDQDRHGDVISLVMMLSEYWTD